MIIRALFFLLLFIRTTSLVMAQNNINSLVWNDADKEAKLLMPKALAGDGEAALKVYQDLTMDGHQGADRSAQKWLLLAVKLKNTEAMRELALDIDDFDYQPYGKTQVDAVENLLREAAKTDDMACEDLAELYSTGQRRSNDHFVPIDLVQARRYYLQGAQLNNGLCWENSARYLHEGTGGPVDNEAAYYWISIDINTIDPQSVGGNEESQLRDEIAFTLPLAKMKREWPKIDAFLHKIDTGAIVIDSAYPDPAVRNEARRKAAIAEIAHRAAMIKRGDIVGTD